MENLFQIEETIGIPAKNINYISKPTFFINEEELLNIVQFYKMLKNCTFSLDSFSFLNSFFKFFLSNSNIYFFKI